MLKKVFSFLLLSLFSGMILVSFIGCSSDEKKSDQAEGAFAIAQEFDKEERYEEAIKRYQEVKNKFPYSKFATMAELAIGDVYFKQESYAEAQVAYQTFRELHPKHAKVDYVIYRLGLSYFKQLPETTDRDLSLAANAIATFEEFIQKFPKSEYYVEARNARSISIRMLAEKEIYVADFYFKKEKYEPALARYLDALDKYSGYGLDAHALMRASLCSARLGNLDRAKKLQKKLNDSFPGSKESNTLEKEIR